MTPGVDASRRLTELGESYFRTQHTYDPLNATLLGLDEFDHLLNDPSTAASQAAARALDDVRAEAEALDVTSLSAAEQVDRQVLIGLARGAADEAGDALWAANVSAKSYVSPQGLVFQAIPVMSAANAAGSEAYLDRLRGLPDLFEGLLDRYRQEIGAGRTPTGLGVHNAMDQIQDYLALGVGEDVLLAPAWGTAAEDEATEVVADVVRPAAARYLVGLREDIAPHGRADDAVGISWIPDGAAAYLRAVRRHTTTEKTTEEIHQLGQEVLSELEPAWAKVGKRVFGLVDPAEVRRALRVDPRMRFETSGQIVDVARAALDRAMATLPTYYDGPAIGPCDIIEINPAEAKHASMAYYRPPALDGSRNGAHCLLTTMPTERFRYEYEALAFHESVPGHHLQLTSCEQLGIPRYRRHLDVEACSFNEGWGLYSEYLAEELGLYSSDIDILGRLSFTALRACRLVIDTGIHHFGWSRESAREFMRANTATNEPNVVNEVDRYIAWPGQALAYLVGQREIIRLREEARTRLGDAFSITAFHRRVLEHGAVPLSVLTANISAWTN